MRKEPVWVIGKGTGSRTAIIRGTIESCDWPTQVLTPADIATTLVGLNPERVVVDASAMTDRTSVLALVEQLRDIGTVRHLVVMSGDSYFATQTITYRFQWIDPPTDISWFQYLADMLDL